MNDELAKELAELGLSDKRLLNKMQARLTHVEDERLSEHASALEANRKRRCELLRQSAKIAGGAGLITGDVTATVIEPKNN